MNHNHNSRQDSDVKQYFEEIAKTFDSYYREEAETGGWIGKVAHLIFRKPAMACRFQATLDYLGDVQGASVLDVGCGSGIYSIEVAKRGGSATGIDVSGAMIELAEENARKTGWDRSCRFLLQDLTEFEPDCGRFRSSIAIGVFDYIPPVQQQAFLGKMLSLVEQDVIATFPKKWVPATFFRKIWFLKKKLEVHFFTKGAVRALVDGEKVEVDFTDCRSIWNVRFRKIGLAGPAG